MTQEQLSEILAARQNHSDLDSLAEREIELFSLLSQGTPWHMICREMGIEPEDLTQLKSGIQKKLGLKNDIQLLQYAAKHRPSRES